MGTYLTTTYMYCLLAQLHANNYTTDVYLEVFDGYSWTDVKLMFIQSPYSLQQFLVCEIEGDLTECCNSHFHLETSCVTWSEDGIFERLNKYTSTSNNGRIRNNMSLTCCSNRTFK